MYSKQQILEVLENYVHDRQARTILDIYLTDYPGSLERLASECDVSVSTVKRVINKHSYIYRYLPGDELKLS